MRYPKTVLVALAALAAALFPYTQRIEVQTDVLTFFSPEHPINVGTGLIESTLSGTTSLEISLRAAERDALQSVATLREVKRLQQWLEAQPEVDRTVSMVDLIEEMHWAMNGEQAAFRALPPSDRLLRQYLLIYDGDDLYELVNRDFDHARIVLNLNVHGTRDIRAAIDRIRQHVEAQPLSALRVEVGGFGRLLADQVDLLVGGQLKSFAGAFAQIFLLMAVLWRSAKAAAVCMVPNIAPLYFILVLMGAAGIDLDLATVMIASVVLGITIDDTIHLYHGYRQRRAAGRTPLWAIARSYESSGRAVLATSVVLIAQFVLLTASDFIPTANFGLMTAVGLAAGLLFEVLLLPALLVLSAGLPWTAASALRWRRQPPARAHDNEWPATVLLVRPPPAHVRPAPLQPPAAFPRRVLVCHDDACKSAGATAVWRRLRAEQDRLSVEGATQEFKLTKTSCLGACRFAPVVQIYPEGTYYGLVDEQTMDRIVNDHLEHGKAVDTLALPPEALGGASAS